MTRAKRPAPPAEPTCVECGRTHASGVPCGARGLRLALRREFSRNPDSDAAFLRRVAMCIGDPESARLTRLIQAAVLNAEGGLQRALDSALPTPAAKVGALLGGVLGAALGMAAEGEHKYAPGKEGRCARCGRAERAHLSGSTLGASGGGAVIPSARTEDQAGKGGGASQSGAPPLDAPSAAPSLLSCMQLVGDESGHGACSREALGAVVLSSKAWAYCERHGGLQRAEDEREAALRSGRGVL